MLNDSQNISLELPAHLLEKLGEDPAKKVRDLLEKYVENEKARAAKPLLSNPAH